jgi:hypothetical protein
MPAVLADNACQTACLPIEDSCQSCVHDVAACVLGSPYQQPVCNGGRDAGVF